METIGGKAAWQDMTTPDEPERAPAGIIAAATELHRAGQHHDAELMLAAAIAEFPASPALRNACGVMQATQGRHAEAAANYRAALSLEASEPAIWTNLGNALTRLRLLHSAVACHDRALALAPDDGGLHYNRGISLAESGRHAEAAAAFTTTLRLTPQHSMAMWDRGRSHLYLGNLAAGWADLEVRLKNGLVPPRSVPGTRWDGTPYAGRHLLLLAEQGFGDMIWTSRYLPLVKALGGTLTVECQPELAPLIAGLGIADRIVLQGETLPEADHHLWQCSLPLLFTHDLAAIPQPTPLTAHPAHIAALRPVFREAGDRLRVGIVWSGSVTFARNADRAQRLAAFIEAFDQPGVQLFSLQKGPPEAELNQAPPGRVINLSPLLTGFDQTAAAIAQLDLVIMTDSAVAHLAGTMGRPVWVLLGVNAHWLWLQERNDCPWYPSMRLFRPRGEQDWSFVFDQAAAALMRETVIGRR